MSRAHPRNHYRYGRFDGAYGRLPAPPMTNPRGGSPYRAYVDAKACDRKMRYVTKGQARQAAKQSLAQHGTELSPYRCPVCGLFHLTKRD